MTIALAPGQARRPLQRRWIAAASAAVLCWAGAALGQATSPPRVRVDTTLGSFVIELEDARAPLTTANFLAYVRSGHYTNTLFHRVINNFVAQAGGYDEQMQPKAATALVANESGNGLSNRRGTVGLARSEPPHSGNAQFYLNLADNEDLDPTPLRWGYAVFGRVVDGMEVVDRIGHVATGAVGPWQKDAPLDPVVIRGMQVIGDPPPVAATPATDASPAAAKGGAEANGAPAGGAAQRSGRRPKK